MTCSNEPCRRRCIPLTDGAIASDTLVVLLSHLRWFEVTKRAVFGWLQPSYDAALRRVGDSGADLRPQYQDGQRQGEKRSLQTSCRRFPSVPKQNRGYSESWLLPSENR